MQSMSEKGNPEKGNPTGAKSWETGNTSSNPAQEKGNLESGTRSWEKGGDGDNKLAKQQSNKERTNSEGGNDIEELRNQDLKQFEQEKISSTARGQKNKNPGTQK